MEGEPARRQFEAVVAAELRFELEVLPDQDRLRADVTVAPAALAVDAAVGPDEFQRRRRRSRRYRGRLAGFGAPGCVFDSHDQPFGGRERHHCEADQAASAEQRITDFIEHFPGPVTRDHVRRLVEPCRPAAGAQSQAQIAAPARQVERELGLVAGVDAERRVPPIERPIEELRPVDDDKIAAIGRVPQRAVEVVLEVWRERPRAERLRPEQPGGTGGHGRKESQNSHAGKGRGAHDGQNTETKYA